MGTLIAGLPVKRLMNNPTMSGYAHLFEDVISTLDPEQKEIIKDFEVFFIDIFTMDAMNFQSRDKEKIKALLFFGVSHEGTNQLRWPIEREEKLFIICHELAHAFLDDGKDFDERFNSQETDEEWLRIEHEADELAERLIANYRSRFGRGNGRRL